MKVKINAFCRFTFPPFFESFFYFNMTPSPPTDPPPSNPLYSYPTGQEKMKPKGSRIDIIFLAPTTEFLNYEIHLVKP